jgi:hypothetical protein
MAFEPDTTRMIPAPQAASSPSGRSGMGQGNRSRGAARRGLRPASDCPAGEDRDEDQIGELRAVVGGLIYGGSAARARPLCSLSSRRGRWVRRGAQLHRIGAGGVAPRPWRPSGNAGPGTSRIVGGPSLVVGGRADDRSAGDRPFERTWPGGGSRTWAVPPGGWRGDHVGAPIARAAWTSSVSGERTDHQGAVASA